MGVPSKKSLVLDMGRPAGRARARRAAPRPELKSDEFFEGTPLYSRDNRTIVLETAQESGSVNGGATRRRAFLPTNAKNAQIRQLQVGLAV